MRLTPAFCLYKYHSRSVGCLTVVATATSCMRGTRGVGSRHFRLTVRDHQISARGRSTDIREAARRALDNKYRVVITLKPSQVAGRYDIYVQLEGTPSILAVCGWCVTSTQPFTEDLFRCIKAYCPVRQGEACEVTGTVVIPIVIRVHKIS